jgi:hypothetical protein
MLDRKKILSYLEIYSNNPPLAGSDEGAFLEAICQAQLGNYKDAKALFEKSANAMFQAPMFWKGSGQPHWFATVCILAGRFDLYANLRQELDIFSRDFKLKNKRESLFAVFADAIIELLLPTDKGISSQVQELLRRPKAKDMYATGLALQAILIDNQTGLENALEKLLHVHEGQAKHGDLRWTAEGLLCLPAMALAFVARKRGLRVNLTNDYLNLGYLEYLLA